MIQSKKEMLDAVITKMPIKLKVEIASLFVLCQQGYSVDSAKKFLHSNKKLLDVSKYKQYPDGSLRKDNGFYIYIDSSVFLTGTTAMLLDENDCKKGFVSSDADWIEFTSQLLGNTPKSWQNYVNNWIKSNSEVEETIL